MKVKSYRLTQRAIINLLNCHTLKKGLGDLTFIQMIDDREGPPEDATVHHMFHSPSTNSLHIVMEHESFDDVPDGHVIPDADGEMLPTLSSLQVINNRFVIGPHLTLSELHDLQEAILSRITELITDIETKTTLDSLLHNAN